MILDRLYAPIFHQLLTLLELLIDRRYDEETGSWSIRTPSLVLPLAIVLPNGEVVPIGWMV